MYLDLNGFLRLQGGFAGDDYPERQQGDPEAFLARLSQSVLVLGAHELERRHHEAASQ
jgi:hypothetical protein